MIYLILAILCSSMVSVLMKLSEKHVKSDAGMFIFNYIACMLLSVLYLPKHRTPQAAASRSGLGAAIIIGLISGFIFLMTFVIFKKNIKRNGVVLSAIFMKLSVVVAVLISIIFFKEKPSVLQLIGFVIALAGIIAFNLEKGAMSQLGAIGFLLILPLFSGLADSSVNIYDKLGTEQYKDLYLLLIFISAFVCAVILFLIRRDRFGKTEIIYGILMGIPNYYISRFLLLSLDTVPSVVVYALYSVVTIVVISIVGLLVFKEKLTKQKLAALVLILISVVLLNMK